jgi:hypothetical protein
VVVPLAHGGTLPHLPLPPIPRRPRVPLTLARPAAVATN